MGATDAKGWAAILLPQIQGPQQLRRVALCPMQRNDDCICACGGERSVLHPSLLQMRMEWLRDATYQQQGGDWGMKCNYGE